MTTNVSELPAATEQPATTEAKIDSTTDWRCVSLGIEDVRRIAHVIDPGCVVRASAETYVHAAHVLRSGIMECGRRSRDEALRIAEAIAAALPGETVVMEDANQACAWFDVRTTPSAQPDPVKVSYTVFFDAKEAATDDRQ